MNKKGNTDGLQKDLKDFNRRMIMKEELISEMVEKLEEMILWKKVRKCIQFEIEQGI